MRDTSVAVRRPVNFAVTEYRTQSSCLASYLQPVCAYQWDHHFHFLLLPLLPHVWACPSSHHVCGHLQMSYWQRCFQRCFFLNCNKQVIIEWPANMLSQNCVCARNVHAQPFKTHISTTVFPKLCQHVCFVRRRIQMSDVGFVKIISIWCLSVQFGRRSMKFIREDWVLVSGISWCILLMIYWRFKWVM